MRCFKMNFIAKLLIVLSTGFCPFLAYGSVHLEKPKDFHPSIEVSGCFIEYQDKFLMLHRQDYKPEGNQWGVPGGKIDAGESPLDAVIREIHEETHFDISQDKIDYFGEVYIKSPKGDKDLTFHMFRCKASEQPGGVKISFKEHKGFTWVTPEDALQMNLMADEDACIKLMYDEVNES